VTDNCHDREKNAQHDKNSSKFRQPSALLGAMYSNALQRHPGATKPFNLASRHATLPLNRRCWRRH